MTKKKLIFDYILGTVLILMLIIGILCILAHIDKTFGQELLHYWSPIEHTPNSFSMTAGVQNWVYKDGNKLIMRSGKKDTVIIEMPFDIDSHYEIKFLGDVFVGRYKNNIKKKKMKFKYSGTGDIEIDGKNIKYKNKDGKVIAQHKFTSDGWKGKNNKPLNITAITQFANEVELEFSDTVYTSDSDSFNWQAIDTDPSVKDARTAEGASGNNYGTSVTIQTGGVTENISYIQFVGWMDSVGTGQDITGVFLSLWRNNIDVSPANDVMIRRGSPVFWLEGTKDGAGGVGQELTWDSNRPVPSSPHSADTLANLNEGNWFRWDVTLMYQLYYDGTFADSGQAIWETPAANFVSWESKNSVTASKRPKIVVLFSPVSVELSGKLRVGDGELNRRVIAGRKQIRVP